MNLRNGKVVYNFVTNVKCHNVEVTEEEPINNRRFTAKEKKQFETLKKLLSSIYLINANAMLSVKDKFYKRAETIKQIYTLVNLFQLIKNPIFRKFINAIYLKALKVMSQLDNTLNGNYKNRIRPTGENKTLLVILKHDLQAFVREYKREFM